MNDVQLYVDSECDADMIEQLVRGAQTGMSKACIPDQTTPSELLSAVCTFLDRTLRAVRKLQTPEERFYNAQEISRVLNDLLVDHGKVPH